MPSKNRRNRNTKKNTKKNATTRSTTKSPKRSWSREEEDRLAEWLLTQRLLFECGRLEAPRVAHLNAALPGWYTPATDKELGHALNVDNPDLNSALETWFNLNGLASEPLTFEEIRVKAAMEM